MMTRPLALPELEDNLRVLKEGKLYLITRDDFRRIFGENDAALGRLRNFAKGHQCAASFADGAVLFRKKLTTPQMPT